MGLTSKKVLKLLRRGEPGRYFDKHGLYLVVASRDSAHWEKRYQLDGKEHYHGLGSTAAFSLAEARQRNRRAAQLLEDGICPIAPTDVRVEEAIEDVTPHESTRSC